MMVNEYSIQASTRIIQENIVIENTVVEDCRQISFLMFSQSYEYYPETK